ncbi:MAG: cell division protein SepF [Synergistaceae bacterium]|nr:cell division protein SepF [Synergistaceae bacterium]
MNIMRWFGFDNDDDDYDDDDYPEERRKPAKSSSRREGNSKSSANYAPGKLILFRGIASENDRIKLREALINGAMVLIDLHELTAVEYEEKGDDFVKFMGGVVFGINGAIIPMVETAQYLLTPRKDMFEAWPEERISE